MEFSKYYQDADVQSFGDNQVLIQGAVETLKPLKASNRSPLHLVLAGFHPSNGSADQFRRFCTTTFSGIAQRRIYLDMNKEPLDSVREKEVTRIQNRIEVFDFGEEVLDLVFLNGTFNYMDGEQLKKLATKARTELKPTGALIAALHTPNVEDKALMEKIDERYKEIGVKPFLRSVDQTAKLMSPLELTYQNTDGKWSVMVLKNSPSS